MSVLPLVSVPGFRLEETVMTAPVTVRGLRWLLSIRSSSTPVAGILLLCISRKGMRDPQPLCFDWNLEGVCGSEPMWMSGKNRGL